MKIVDKYNFSKLEERIVISVDADLGFDKFECEDLNTLAIVESKIEFFEPNDGLDVVKIIETVVDEIVPNDDIKIFMESNLNDNFSENVDDVVSIFVIDIIDKTVIKYI